MGTFSMLIVFRVVGYDDLNTSIYKTWQGYAGVYVNNNEQYLHVKQTVVDGWLRLPVRFNVVYHHRVVRDTSK